MGTSTVTVMAADPASATAMATFTITINPGATVPLVVNLVVSPTSIPVNGSTSGTATVSGGRAPYTYDFGTDAGAGISTTGNRVTYTEMSAGDHNLTVKVVDSTLPTAQTVTASFKVTVGAQGATPVVKVNSPDPVAGETKAGSAKNPAMAKNSQDVKAAATEDIDPGVISFTRSTTAGTLVVYYSLGGTATPGVDFLNLPGSVTFAEGESEILVEVDPIADDSEDEGDETVIINLIDKDDYDPDPTQTNTTVTIKDKATAAPSSLTITSFSCNVTNGVLSSVNFVVGNANGSFSPQPAPIFINGVTGNGQLGVNYFLPFDNNQSTLTVQDQATRSTYFVWNFRQACAARGSAREALPNEAPWLVTVLGNPTSQYIDVVISGAKGETLMMSVTDATGRPIMSRRVQPQSQSHREVVDVSAQSTGLLLLKTSSDTHAQTIKVIKN
ncbi:hypothetical protein BLX24_29875 [Arsenicibacter rosenii]|uniref:Calx-beta domain-containing protein n=1 Tax=Arsenicibacter rosenii TaxID=1750698 RepID=A0A1S2V9V1_9BACT|nr:hypothetical protein BLX24_29875 [Arsenicibacter rosenii]